MTCAFAASPYSYSRRQTREVIVGDPARGGVIIGGDHPVVKQSMITCDTMDTAAVRAKQTWNWWPSAARSCASPRRPSRTPPICKNIVAELRARGCQVADRRRHPFQARRRHGSRPMGRDGARQSGQLRRQEEIRRPRIQPTSNTTRNWRASRSSSRRWSSFARSWAAPCASAPITVP